MDNECFNLYLSLSRFSHYNLHEMLDPIFWENTTTSKCLQCIFPNIISLSLWETYFCAVCCDLEQNMYVKNIHKHN